jgi:hypothetical protein
VYLQAFTNAVQRHCLPVIDLLRYCPSVIDLLKASRVHVRTWSYTVRLGEVVQGNRLGTVGSCLGTGLVSLHPCKVCLSGHG